MAEIKFYRDAEHEQQVYPMIDPDGNFPGVTVGLANNIISPDGSTTDEYFTFRPTGGTSINPSEGYATIKQLRGNAVSSTVAENLTTNLTATGVTSVTTETSTFRDKVSSTSGTYNFIYTPIINYSSTLIYSFSQSTFAKFVSQVTGSYTFTYVANISEEDASELISSFTESTFISKTNSTPGTYAFTYNGSNWELDNNNVTMSQYGITTKGTEVDGDIITINYMSNEWQYDSSSVDMARYGITTTGSEAIGDTITINYNDNEWQLNANKVELAEYGIAITNGDPIVADRIQIVYTAERIGAIVVAKPSALRATGLNAFDYENNVYANFALDENGNIVSNPGQSVGFFECLENYTYTIYDSDETSGITRVGFSKSKPTSSSTDLTILEQTTKVLIDGSDYGTATNTTYMKHYNPASEGWIVVSGPSALMEALSCHLTWDQSYDNTYENYWTYDFEISYTDKEGTLALPYGLVKVDDTYQDVIDYENNKIYRRVERLDYSSANLIKVQQLTDHYIYDSNYIYYGIDTITYSIEGVSSAYPESDFGTEEFLDTELSVQARIFYQVNLRDKLRNDVEVKTNKVITLDRTDSSEDYRKVTYPSTGVVLDLDNALRRILGLDVDTFSESKTYDEGDYVVKDLKLWKCITAITSAGEWTGNGVKIDFGTDLVSSIDYTKFHEFLAQDAADCDEDSLCTISEINSNGDGTYSVHLTYTEHPSDYDFDSAEALYQKTGIRHNGVSGFIEISYISSNDNWEESYLFKA